MKQCKYLQTTIKDLDEKGRVRVAANALGNVDADKDMSMEGSFVKTLKEHFNRVRWFLNHNTNILLGVPIEGKESYPYLEMTGQLNMKKEVSRDVYEDYKLYAEYGKSLEHSIGVEALKKDSKDGVRKVFEWKLWEYSTLFGWGANENTPMLGIKSLEDISSIIDWFELKLKKGNYTDERFMKIESQLNILRSLCTEPENSTLKAKPDVLIEVIKNFRNTLVTT